ncbi:MAG: hypothetical protein KAT71_08165 [Gammaproteobacteria bacterium]|nr:hypothetical protein [Gammaproteobacteria bacterium]
MKNKKKVCDKCKSKRDISCFGVRSDNGKVRNTCKSCLSAQAKATRAKKESFVKITDRGGDLKNEYRIVKGGKVLATVFFKPFFITLVGSGDDEKEAFERCYEADLRDLQTCFAFVLSDHDIIKRLVTTF